MRFRASGSRLIPWLASIPLIGLGGRLGLLTVAILVVRRFRLLAGVALVGALFRHLEIVQGALQVVGYIFLTAALLIGIRLIALVTAFIRFVIVSLIAGFRVAWFSFVSLIAGFRVAWFSFVPLIAGFRVAWFSFVPLIARFRLAHSAL